MVLSPIPPITRYQRFASGKPSLGEKGAVSAQIGLFGVDDYGVFDKPTTLDLERMLDTDSQARALENSVVLPIRQATSYIEEGKGDKGEAKFAREVLFNDPNQGGMQTDISTLVARMCGAFARRAAFFEKVWKYRDDGKLVYDDVAFRRASTCKVIPDLRGRYNGYWQQGFTSDGKLFQIVLPPNKTFVYIHGASSVNPLAGESLFESAWQDYDNKRKLKIIAFLYYQKFGIPATVGHTESPAKEDQEAMMEKAASLSGGAAAGTGPGETLQALEVRPGADFGAMLQYLDTQMAISMLVQWLMLGTGNDVGSWALSQDHSDFFMLASQARMNEIARKITYDLVAPLVYYNFGKDASYPKFRFSSLADQSEAEALKIWRDLLMAPAGSQGAAALHPDVFAGIQQKALAALDFDPSLYKGKIPTWIKWGSWSQQQQAAAVSPDAKPAQAPVAPSPSAKPGVMSGNPNLAPIPGAPAPSNKAANADTRNPNPTTPRRA